MTPQLVSSQLARRPFDATHVVLLERAPNEL